MFGVCSASWLDEQIARQSIGDSAFLRALAPGSGHAFLLQEGFEAMRESHKGLPAETELSNFVI